MSSWCMDLLLVKTMRQWGDEEFRVQAFSFVSKIIFSLESIEEENIVWLKRELNYLTENLSKLNAVGQ